MRTPNFVRQGDVVVDDTHGLMWTSKTLNEEACSQQECEQLAKDCRVGDHSDWRLPTIQELLTLVDYERKGPAINPALFPGTENDWYWTSTPWAGSPADFAWGVYFGLGGADYNHRINNGFARAVRSVPPAAGQ